MIARAHAPSLRIQRCWKERVHSGRLPPKARTRRVFHYEHNVVQNALLDDLLGETVKLESHLENGENEAEVALRDLDSLISLARCCTRWPAWIAKLLKNQLLCRRS